VQTKSEASLGTALYFAREVLLLLTDAIGGAVRSTARRVIGAAGAILRGDHRSN
jgi:hypothetical protein